MARKNEKETAAEKFGKMMRRFGDTLGDIMEDPELRKKAREFAQSAVDAAAKVANSKIKDEEAKARFRSVGKAAQDFGKSVEENFKPEKASQA
jgi:ribosomal-protein-alanine N-acetyltransferase